MLVSSSENDPKNEGKLLKSQLFGGESQTLNQDERN
jgi:hypothetical protein